MKVKKRDGTIVPFDKDKIINAINKAFIEVDGQLYEDDTAKDIAEEIFFLDREMSVEEIQDKVEEFLMESERKDVARSYVRYRYKKEVARERKDDFFTAMEEKLSARNIENQNANIDEASFGGRMGEATSVMTKEYALNNLCSKMARDNHLNNRIYIHDLNSYAVGMHNCLSIPFDDLLAKGFNTRQIDVRPANSVNTAFQLIAVIFQLQSLQQFGGVSATHLDWTMVPYVRKSFAKHYMDGMRWIEATNSEDHMHYKNKLWVTKFFNDCSIEDKKYERNMAYKYAMEMTIKEIHQAVEGMYHNLNTLQSRSGNQLPFTSINYGTCTLPEGRMVIKALLDVSIEGLGSLHRTSIFPCGIWQCMKGVNREPGDPNYDLYQLALKSTALRLYPNYTNVDWSVNEGYDPADPRTYVSTMGCRTYNGADINAEPGINPQMKDGRGNIAPTTIIMPTLAMEVVEHGKERGYSQEVIMDAFFDYLDDKIHEAKDMLIERFDWICSQPSQAAQFMYENGLMYGYKPEEGIRSALKHGTLVVG